jgi:predicted phosphate transport protein (TIGR00153 family)
MLFKFLPKECNFFDLFDKQADIAVKAAEHFRKLASRGAVDDAALKTMEDLEHQGDDLAHQIFERLNKTFITPFDREDIHSLAKQLDDVIDMINTIVSRQRIYKLTAVDKKLIEFSAVIEDSVKAVSSCVKGLRNMKDLKCINEACVEINRLENVGDEMRDKALAELFEKCKDPITVIKLKEVYQDAETVLDICEDVTHVVGAILLKQA